MPGAVEPEKTLSTSLCPQHQLSSVDLSFSILGSFEKNQPCLVSLFAGASELGAKGDSAPALLLVVALEAAAGAGSATARSPHPVGTEVAADAVEDSAAGASTTWEAAQGFPWAALMAMATDVELVALVEDSQEDLVALEEVSLVEEWAVLVAPSDVAPGSLEASSQCRWTRPSCGQSTLT